MKDYMLSLLAQGNGVLGRNAIFNHRGNMIINLIARAGVGCKTHGDVVLGLSLTGSSGCSTFAVVPAIIIKDYQYLTD